MIAVALYRMHDRSWDAGLLKDRLPVLRVSLWIPLVIEIVEEPGDRPGLLVFAAVLSREAAHGGLHGEAVFPKALRLRVLAQKIPGFIARHRSPPARS